MNAGARTEQGGGGRRARWRTAALGGAMAAAVFCLAISVSLAINYIQLKIADPLNSAALIQLRQQFSQEQGDETLKTQIRALDLLARKAFFTTQWQLRVGGLLLLGGVGTLVLFSLAAKLLEGKTPNPRNLPSLEAAWIRRVGVRRGTWLAGGILVAAGLAAWIGAERNMAEYWVVQSAPTAQVRTAAPVPAPTLVRALPAAPTRDDLLRNWPNFRGPDGNGIATARNIPVAWDGAKRQGIRWKQATPRPGYSSPVVWGQRVFLTGADKEARELYGLDADTGSLMWTTAVNRIQGAAVVEIPDVNESTGLAAPSPATDGRWVCAIFGTGELLCTDLDGKPLWSRFLGKPDNHYGHASSLLIVGDLLIVQLDDASHPRVLGLDGATGKTVWETTRQAISWASPICVDTGARREVILCDSAAVESYDPKTGVSLWRQDCLGGEVAPSAAYGDGMVFVANAYAKACGLRLAGGTATVAWESSETLPDTASPLVAGGCLFLATQGGPIVCLNAKDGKPLWQKEFTTECYASPVCAEGRVYALDLDGVMHIFEVGGTYREIGTCPLGETAGATPALMDDRLYIRGVRNLYCVGAQAP